MLNISLTWTGREAARQMALRARTLDSPVKGLAGLASHLRRAAEEAPPGCPGATRYWLDTLRATFDIVDDWPSEDSSPSSASAQRAWRAVSAAFLRMPLRRTFR